MAVVPRLFIDAALGKGAEIALEKDQAHYLVNVMRRKDGDPVRVFNGKDGEWRAEVAQATKRAATIKLAEQTRPQHSPPDLWLLFAPVKKSRTDFIVEKATELGAVRIAPVFTRFTNSERVRMDRMEALAREAAEQTERLDLPVIAEARTLDQALDGWDATRPLIYCDEGGEVPPMLDYLLRLCAGGDSLSPKEAENAAGFDVLPPSPGGEGWGGGRSPSANALAQARRMRAAPTKAEAKLWQILRSLKRPGAHFRRQVPIGPFIADFACLSLRLIVEADGGGHGGRGDLERDQWLQAQGYRILRIWNSEILGNPSGVAEQIAQTMEVRTQESPTLNPSPAGEGDLVQRPSKLAVLIGPEGGFSEDERARLKSLDFVRPVSLGPRILRADTAAAAALALIQSAWGDWD